jgi:hypothetical protein
MSKNSTASNMDFTKLPALPEVKFAKSGFEIRTEVLAMAKDLVAQDFHVKFQGWEMTAKRDENTGQVVTSVDMPQFPGLDKVLETAEKMYSFVNASNYKK